MHGNDGFPTPRSRKCKEMKEIQRKTTHTKKDNNREFIKESFRGIEI